MGFIKRLFTFSFIIFMMNTSPMTISSSFAADSEAKDNTPQQIGVNNPSTDLWRAVRQRNVTIQGNTQSRSPKADILIDPKGNEWRKVRREKLVPYSAYFITGVLGLLLLLFLVVRKVDIPGGKSGNKVKRMSGMQRFSHWFMASLIGFMTITGLLLFSGRFLLIPIMGNESFSYIASASRLIHNYLSPLVILSLIMMLVYFIKYNLPGKGDMKWIFTLGGLLTKGHLKNGFFNFGEKILFWFTMLLGFLLSITGLVLLFPFLELTVIWTQVAITVHVITAFLLIALTFGHIWMALTVKGTLDAMKSGGYVDENWAKSHHGHWYDKIKGKGET